MRKNLTLITALVTIFSLAGFGVAQAKTMKISIGVPKDPSVSLSVATKENQTTLQNATSLSVVIEDGSELITTRLNTLANLKTSINNSKLTADEKTSLNSTIADNINGLTQLKIKLAAETDLTAAKADVSSMFTDYRIYGILKPKITALRTINLDSNNLTALQTTTFTNYQAKIDALKTSGGNATLIANMEAGLAKAKTAATTTGNLINSSMTLAQNLVPADYPTQSKTTLTNIRTDLNKIRTDFRMIRTDLGAKGKVSIMAQ